MDVTQMRCQSVILPTDLQTRKLHWYDPALKDGQKMRAVALVVHGLNNHPEVMLPIVKFLNEQGVGVLNVGLTGYVGNFDDLKKVTAAEWLQDVFTANCVLQTKAKNLPQFFVGFSLGALIGDTLLNSNLSEKFEFAKAVFFSPALRVHDRSQWIQMFSFLGRGFSMISFAPKAYAASWKTPNAAYQALFDLIDLFNQNLVTNSQAVNIATLAFVDPDDELVSSEYLEEMVGTFSLDRWQMNEVHKDNTAKTWFHHVTIDEHAMGKQTWQQMTKKITDFLR